MQMRPDIQLQSVIKTLTEVVLPALDPSHQLAQEQIRIAIGVLGLMRQQIPLQFRFDCDELRRWLKFASSLDPFSAEGHTTLVEQVRRGHEVLERAKADPNEVAQAVSGLRAATGALIADVYASKGATDIALLTRAVLEVSDEQLLRERAWFRSQGWEPQANLPSIESLLDSTYSD